MRFPRESIETLQLFAQMAMRSLIVAFFCYILWYMLSEHVGIDEGQVKPTIVWSFVTGAFAGFLGTYFNK